MRKSRQNLAKAGLQLDLGKGCITDVVKTTAITNRMLSTKKSQRMCSTVKNHLHRKKKILLADEEKSKLIIFCQRCQMLKHYQDYRYCYSYPAAVN